MYVSMYVLCMYLYKYLVQHLSMVVFSIP